MADQRFHLAHHSALSAVPVSQGELSEVFAVDLSGIFSGRRVDLDGMRRATPGRWMAFLHAQFPDHVAVAYFFSVDEKTARNWWHGKNEPRLSAFAAMLRVVPVSYRNRIISYMAAA